jgi:flavin reductase (DIM6/NTAB) family NADH-FMN oxidoreductase RutF
MTRQSIAIEKLQIKPQQIWGLQGMILTCGDWESKHFNCMAVGWGSLGVMWKMPFAQVVVRPVRYTYEFMERYETFTLCAFGENFAQAIDLLGTKSGRDGDKIAEAGLSPIASTQVAAPGFAEAELILECRKVYWDDMDKGHFLDARIDQRYPAKDYHRIYYGEIVAVMADAVYRA